MITTTSTISVATCRLRLPGDLRAGQAPALRGFFGRQFEDEIFMHNHNADGSVVYQYPRVQFKILKDLAPFSPRRGEWQGMRGTQSQRHAVLIGVNEGSELLQRLWLDIDHAKIGQQEMPVLESNFEVTEHDIRLSPEPIMYRFATPWLALNQKNHAEYMASRDKQFRREKLERTLIGNCLSLCKSLGVPRFTRDQQLIANCHGLKQIKTSLKGQGMIGFVGKFQINLHLPDLIGLGKSVSRGFGTIERGA